jgi:hypothetical protein
MAALDPAAVGSAPPRMRAPAPFQDSFGSAQSFRLAGHAGDVDRAERDLVQRPAAVRQSLVEGHGVGLLPGGPATDVAQRHEAHEPPLAEEYGDLGQYTVRLEGPNVESIISNLRLDDEQELKGLDLRAGDLWYRIETKRGGPLLITASAKDERSDLAIKLYDGNLRELAVSDELAVSLRHRVAKGAAYHLQVSGRSDSLGLRLQIGGTPFAHPLSEEAANHKR